MRRARLFVPEVVQTSAMDCGPASLKAILDGFGIPVSYGRLREACQTQIDGTSIDTMEEVACQLGLDAEQVMVPADHLLLEEAQLLPALVVIRQPSGATHFVVAWRRFGVWVQIMDPATGRRWQTRSSFLRDLYLHAIPVPAAGWLEWALSDDFLGPLAARLAAIGLSRAKAQLMLEQAQEGNRWYPLAALDAATRLVTSLVQSGGLKSGREAVHVLRLTFSNTLKAENNEDEPVAAGFWSVRPAGEDEDGEEILQLRGAVLVRFRGSLTGAEHAAAEIDEPATEMPEELKAALKEKPQQPGRELLRLLRQDGILPPLAVITALFVSSATVLMEALLFRGMLDLGRFLGFAEQRLLGIVAFLILLLCLALLALPNMVTVLRQGRHLETRLRMAFLAKIPRLGDRYFHSRLSSDMAERAHAVHQIRGLPVLAGELWRAFSLLLATVGGIIWLDPASATIAVVTATVSVALPLIAQRFLIERDLRVRTHVGALTRFFLDSLLGLTALRCHAAERAVRREHEMLLVEWARASLGLLRIAVTVEGLIVFTGYFMAVWLLVDHVARAGESGMVLLLVYWVLALPAIGQQIALTARQIPAQRNITLRLLEPLGAPDETSTATVGGEVVRPVGSNAIEIEFKGVCVQAGGHTILDDIHLHVPAGSHVAIVGPSGAGKSSLVGLLLGWHRPTLGSLKIDGAPLDGSGLEYVRRHTAWVDPAVRLWNRSFIDNISYGSEGGTAQPLTTTLEQARLYDVLERLPDGLQTLLGEGGGLVSGGEGQRLRLGRGLNRKGVRLAILDEPFRGLDRVRRRQLMDEARRRWADATLLCVTHDIRETLAFERVIVVVEGRIVEDGASADLRNQPNSVYRQLLEADEDVHVNLWMDPEWRRLTISGGVLDEELEDQP